jgi:hypothetical protein
LINDVRFDYKGIMPEKTKQPGAPEKENKKTGAETDEETTADDRRRRSYYYDDAHGYEIYDGGEADDEEAATGAENAPAPENS